MASTIIALAAASGGQAALAQTPIPPKTPDYVMSAAQSDQYEIEAAQDALAQSRNPRIRDFAQHMIQDHSRASDTLRQAATTAGLPPPPPAISSDQAAMLSALQSQRGPTFDKTYIKQQVLAHHQALAVQESYAAAGGNSTLRGVAQTATPIIRQHLEMAEQIGAALGEP